MAQIQDNNHRTKPRSRSSSSSFLDCFGFCRKVPEIKTLVTVNPGDSRRRKRWLSLSWFRLKRTGVRTVPVGPTTMSKEANQNKHIETDKKSSEHHFPTTSPEQTLHDKSTKRRNETAQNMVIMEVINENNEALLPHSNSRSQPRQRKQATEMTRKSPETKPTVTGKFEPVIGMSIVTVTLVVMLVWGRLCAILCTSAWFYFLPCLRSSIIPKATGSYHIASVQNGTKQMDLDFSSREYKKKVVLEGFLSRQHQNV